MSAKPTKSMLENTLLMGTVCSGIEAPSVAFNDLPIRSVWFSEVEPFPCDVLAARHSDTPDLGCMMQVASAITEHAAVAPDLLTGGTPCQAFSVAGLRKGLSDPRGALTIEYVRILDAIDERRFYERKPACIALWENVPGVLSSKDNAFGCFLAALAGEDCELVPAGRKWTNAGYVLGPKRAIAWRVLDAQYFGLAQRRRRVFVVASARTGFDPAAILFERDSVRRDTPPSRGEREEIAGTLASRTRGGGFPGTDEACAGYVQPVASTGAISHYLNAGGMGRLDYETETMIVHGTQDPCVGSIAFALGRNHGQENALSVSLRGREGGATAELGEDIQNCLRASGGGGDKPHVLASSMVRRLTPRECERLQGFPDDYTRILVRGKLAADGPRYKAIGNSMAVPVIRWIGERILRQLTEEEG